VKTFGKYLENPKRLAQFSTVPRLAQPLPNPVLNPDTEVPIEPKPEPVRVTTLHRNSRRKPDPVVPPLDGEPETAAEPSSAVERVEDANEAALTKDELKEMTEFIKDNKMSTAVVHVYRRRPLQTAFGFLGEMPIDGFSVKILSDLYGGGSYRLKILVNGRIKRGFSLEIDPSIKGQLDKEQEKPAPVAPVVPVIAPKDDTLAIMLQLSKESAEVQRQLAKESKEASDRAADRQMAMMTEMVKAIATRPEAPKGPDFLQIITAITPLLTPVLAAVLNRPDQLDLVMKAKELFQTEPQPEEQMLDKLLRVGAPLAQQFMSRGQPQMQPAPMPVQAQPEAAPGLPSTIPALPPGIPVGMATESVQVAMAVRGHLPSLVGMASRGGAIDWIVPMVENSMNDAQLEHLDAILLREDWRAVLFGDAPEVTTAYRPWFDALRDAFLQDDGQEVAT